MSDDATRCPRCAETLLGCGFCNWPDELFAAEAELISRDAAIAAMTGLAYKIYADEDEDEDEMIGVVNMTDAVAALTTLPTKRRQ